jgi:hypothetical protein
VGSTAGCDHRSPTPSRRYVLGTIGALGATGAVAGETVYYVDADSWRLQSIGDITAY